MFHSNLNMFQKKIKISKQILIKIEKELITVSKGNKVFNHKVPKSIVLTINSNDLILESNNKAMLGLHESILKRKIQGIIQNFKKILILNGLGFKVLKENNQLIFKLGYSHDVIISIPAMIRIELLKANQLILYSSDWEQLTQFCANLRKLKKIDPYKGKGILFKNEQIKLKEGKKK